MEDRGASDPESPDPRQGVPPPPTPATLTTRAKHHQGIRERMSRGHRPGSTRQTCEIHCLDALKALSPEGRKN